jgi:hypothetical protein
MIGTERQRSHSSLQQMTYTLFPTFSPKLGASYGIKEVASRASGGGAA